MYSQYPQCKRSKSLSPAKTFWGRCHGLVPWFFTLASTQVERARFPVCHGLVPWSFTLVIKRKPVAAINGSLHGASPWHRTGKGGSDDRSERDTPRDKPVASTFGCGLAALRQLLALATLILVA